MQTPTLSKQFSNIDWVLLAAILPILIFGLVTMHSFSSLTTTAFFTKQLIWISISFGIFLFISQIDIRFWKRTGVLVGVYLFSILLLAVLFVLGHVSNGAQSWFDFGGFSFQPSDIMKLVVVLMLAKYFSRRHVEIKHSRHIFVSALYAFIPFFLVFLQPDFGSAIIIFLVWFGMVLVSGISKKHILIVFGTGILAFLTLWFFVFHPYQKARILNFIHPMSDIRGTGYNAYQSTIAVGSGQFIGKGIGFGTQSRLQFLPEYQTDFIFAAFAEEWGFIGALILFILYGIVLWRILRVARFGATNFEILFSMGFAILIASHLLINIGMNIGLMPVTGITLPFMSYGGSHMIMLFIALGILMSARKHARTAHQEDMRNEFLGI